MKKKVDPNNLVGIAEIAEFAGVTKQAVTNWAARHPKFPKPVRVLKAGPVFLATDVAEWLEASGRS